MSELFEVRCINTMDFWQRTLGAPTRIVAPMVDASELAWRMLSRHYGAQLCYTPMLHSTMFCRDARYRKEALATCKDDTPLIIQFCGNDPRVMLEAALLAESESDCQAIDINLGCPQAIAKRGNYGAFLQEKWDLIGEMVSLLSKSLTVPVTCKVRIFEDVEKTVAYARMLEEAGCKMLTVHGRTREQKGPLTGLANWDYVKAVRAAVRIPVISNGNIHTMQDVERCIAETGVQGVMTAEGNLHNPAIFLYQNPPAWQPALEYLDLVEQYPCPTSYTRGHLFKLFHHVLSMPENYSIRINLGAAGNLEQFRAIVFELKEKYEPYHEGVRVWEHMTEVGSQNALLPPWVCQPYVRDSPVEHLQRIADKQKIVAETNAEDLDNKRHYEDADGNKISRKRMKKLRRIGRRPERAEQTFQRNLEKCSICANPLGSKCIRKMCKKCCREKCFLENLDCEGHRILVKKRREMAQFYAEEKRKLAVINQ